MNERVMTPCTARAVQAFGRRLRRLSFGKHPALLFNPGVEGFRDHTFGGRAGPSVNVLHLFHELAHAAQFGPDQFQERCTPHGFVFRNKTIFMAGRLIHEPHTNQSTERELQTFAFQLHLARAAGLKFSEDWFVQDSAHVMRLMPDWWHVPGGDEAGRKAHCASRIEAFYTQASRQEVCDRVEAWLDQTSQRLRSKKGKTRAYHQVDERWRSDGTLFQ